MNTDTPETEDADYMIDGDERVYVCIDFARRLERERDEARKVAEFWLAVACGPFDNGAALPWKAEK